MVSSACPLPTTSTYKAKSTPERFYIDNYVEARPVLAYFDPGKEVTLQVDASKHGLGATMMQEGRPVAFPSKMLNSTEQD